MRFERVSDIDRLLEEQIASWPLLALGTEGLKGARTRAVNVHEYTVLVRHLPHRISSTTARVDRASVQNRPCFLCASNLPPEQKGLEFGTDLTIYCNPFPILGRHLTIVHREHAPQRIVGQIKNMVALAEALPGFVILYNGPEAGASAPDHMHFQACSMAGLPIVDDVKRAGGSTIPHYGRHTLIFTDPAAGFLEEQIGDPEPMLNLAMFRDGGKTTAIVFPRSKHRPAVFHSGEFTVSPAAIDLCGVFVTPLESDFQRISGEDIREIFEEVTRPLLRSPL